MTKKGEGNCPVWLDDGEVIRVFPVPEDPLKALRGAGKGEGLLNCLLQDRREDRERGLLHKDPEYDALAEEIDLEALPYKVKQGDRT